ncbi:MAG: hypothetical protein IT584_00535 [Chlamydiae bacterium]|nr:hypothetical protein [Chlamydiota bacterium]
MNLILFGFKASGKTHFAKRASDLLQRTFIDTDELMKEEISQKTRSFFTISQIYERLGEKGFRELEARKIQELSPHPIIAVGGGAVLDLANVKHLQTLGQLVYLQASFETVRDRILKGPIPAFLDSKDLLDSLKQLYHERCLIYKTVPALCIDVDKLSEQMILKQLKGIFFDGL